MTDERDLATRVRAIEDRLAIEDVIVRYARAVDGHDDELLASCFTDDAEASFGGVPAGRGGPAIAAFLASVMGGDVRPASLHRFTNVAVAIDGDEADVQSSAIVYGVRGEPEQVRLRSCTYHDRFVRSTEGWRIARRVHAVAWEGGAEHLPLSPIRPGDE